MPQPIHQVDAFTAQTFRGNPAAVCLLHSERPTEWMQAVAGEMALSETAFLLPRPGGDDFDLRWFTPAVEVDLCGHATLAAAHVLWETGALAADQEAVFSSRSGRLTARRRDGWIEMDFPADPPSAATVPPGLAETLGVAVERVSRSRLYLLAEVADAATLRRLRPDLARLRSLDPPGLIVTCDGAGTEFDFLSRFFAPALGVDEDPVTGSAHCVLAPFWARRLGRESLTGFQASVRGGVVRTRLAADRVLLQGQAVTVLRGELIDS